MVSQTTVFRLLKNPTTSWAFLPSLPSRGDGTQGIAAKLSAQNDINIIGIPKTIDNDLFGTERTIGFSTAVETVTDCLVSYASTAESHERVMVAEVMGRDAGHIALHAGAAAGANVILLPEIPFSIDSIMKKFLTEENREEVYNYLCGRRGLP